MKRFISCLALVVAAAAPALYAQSTSPLTVSVSAVTGVSTQGLTVELLGEESGWVFNPVKVNDSGIARFSYVPAGTFTLKVDGSPLGLENYVNTNVVHDGEQTVNVVLNEAVRTPYALKSALAHDDFTGKNSLTLSWNRETDYFFDDFESYEPFAIDFAPWTGIDLDREQAAEIQGSYPNRGLQQYATIFNALTIDPPVYYEYEVLRPYSGKQFVGFVRTRSGAANNDWLISPKIKVGVNNIVSFMAKASDYTPDRFTVNVSTTGTDVKDFVQLTPGNYQTVDYKTWQEIAYSLAAYEGQEVYVAIHCVSQNGFMLMVDDFYVGPASMPRISRRVSRRSADNPNEKFIITLDGVKAGETDDYSYTISDVPAGTHTAGVSAEYVLAKSDEATISVEVPGSDSYAALTLSVTADIDDSLEGIAVNLLSVTTARSTVAVLDADGKAEIPFLAKDEYLLNISSDLFDEYNTNFTLDADKTIEVALTETLTAPFNLLYQTKGNEDGSYDVEFSWNADLGFRDSFETYPDFTQEFGDWTVFDLDKMPTYAFSIAGTEIEVPEKRGLVGAMIFNPNMTKPVRASDDGLFQAPDGEKYVMFNSAESAKSDDWLLTPELRIGREYVLRFSAKSYTDMYPGNFEFCAVKDLNLGSPDYLDAFQLTENWTRYEISLSDYEGESIQLGFHHITYDGWLSFIDDVYVGPGDESAAGDEMPSRCSFDIYLDSEFVANVQEPSWTATALAPGKHKIGIQAVYPSGRKSEVTELEFTVETNGISGIAGAEGSWRYFDLNGLAVKADRLGKGVYIRTNGTITEKIIRD